LQWIKSGFGSKVNIQADADRQPGKQNLPASIGIVDLPLNFIMEDFAQIICSQV
jgi:hypothetical protein